MRIDVSEYPVSSIIRKFNHPDETGRVMLWNMGKICW